MSVAARYTWAGIVLGFCFPAGSVFYLHLTGHHLHPFDLGGFLGCVAQGHRDNSLLYVIDTAPLLLGLFGYFAGVREAHIRRLKRNLEREVPDKIESLRRALIETRKANETIVYLAEHDALTGLINRRRFLRETQRWLDHTQRYRRPVALAYLDLDHFKHLNDTHGHDAGDFLLLEVAATLQSTFRSTDCVARFGGDEFVVLMPDSTGSQAIVATEKLLRALHETTITIRDEKHPASASIGLAVAPDHATRAEELIRCADTAMYTAKQAGRGCWRLYAPAMGHEPRAGQ